MATETNYRSKWYVDKWRECDRKHTAGFRVIGASLECIHRTVLPKKICLLAQMNKNKTAAREMDREAESSKSNCKIEKATRRNISRSNHTEKKQQGIRLQPNENIHSRKKLEAIKQTNKFQKTTKFKQHRNYTLVNIQIRFPSDIPIPSLQI